DDAHLDHDVVPRARLEAREHRHLSTALDLEDADGVRLTDALERLRIVRRDARHVDVDAVVLAQEIEAAMELRERAEAEEVDLEETELLEVVLVPLDDRAIRHRAVLDRDEIAHRLLAEEKAAGVDRE